MGFNVLSKAPEPSEMIAPSTPYTAVLPSLDLFRNELKFWRNERSGPDSVRRAVQYKIRSVAFGRIVVESMVDQTIPYAKKTIDEWHMRGATTVAWSRMWQEMHGMSDYSQKVSLNETKDLAISGLVADFDPKDLEHTGIHLSEENLVHFAGIESPPPAGETLWLEGGSVFLRVRSPAQPTAWMSERQDVVFPANDLTSFVPHLKIDEWR